MAANQVTVATPGPAGATGLVYEGLWVTSSVYQVRDLVRYTDGNLYVCNVQHTAASGNTPVLDSTTWSLFINADDAFQWATKVKHTQITDSIGNTGYSALHQAAKALDWASLTSDAVTNDANSGDVDYSAKAWAIGGTEVTTTASRGASKEWAIGTGRIDDPSTGGYSAKEHATGTTVAEGSAKEWATTDTDVVAGGLYSSKQYAANSATSATESAASETAANASADAVAVMYDAFHDKFLGSMVDGATQGTNPTTNGTWGKNSSSITVVSATNIKVGQVVTGTGMPTSPKPNVISIASTTVVLSDNMDAAGSAVALSFVGSGIYGAFDVAKDGPALNNDGNALTDGLLYFNTTDDVMLVYDETSSAWKRTTPTSAEQTAINAVNADASDIGAVAGKATEIGRLGTAAVITDMGLLGSSTITDDMALLAVPAVITDMDLLGATGVIGDIETLADNISSVTDFASKYRIASSDPGSDNDEGDLYYNTSTNSLAFYDGSAWSEMLTDIADNTVIANNAAVAMSIALG